MAIENSFVLSLIQENFSAFRPKNDRSMESEIGAAMIMEIDARRIARAEKFVISHFLVALEFIFILMSRSE